MHELIHDLALSIVMAWLLGVAAYLARQPLILAYLVAGFAAGTVRAEMGPFASNRSTPSASSA